MVGRTKHLALHSFLEVSFFLFLWVVHGALVGGGGGGEILSPYVFP
jgi:hypothetical protein